MKTILITGTIIFAQFILFGQSQPNEDNLITPTLLEELNRDSKLRIGAEKNDRDVINGWVSFERTMYDYVYGPDQFYTYGQVISTDSLARVSFSDGVYPSFTQGFGQLFDPTADDMELSDAKLLPVDSYEIDSIGFPCLYRRVNHNGIDDTLRITVAVTNKETGEGNPYDGSYWWTPGGLLASDMYILAPSYEGVPVDGRHNGLLGFSDVGADVEIQVYEFLLTDADTEINWKAFPVNIEAEADQIVYTMVEFRPAFVETFLDTAFVFDGAEGEATMNSFRTVYDYPTSGSLGHFFDLYRPDEYSYNASYIIDTDLRYKAFTGPDDWRNNRLDIYGNWGFRFEYYMNATSSIGINENESSNLNIYPNPTKDQINIQFRAPYNGMLIIKDIAGKEIFSQKLIAMESMQLEANILGLSAGVYLVELSNEETVETKKIVIE